MIKRQRSAFWDSSAVVPLLCRDSYTTRSREFLRRFPEAVSWWNTPVEVHGALVRLFKEKRITQEALNAGLSYLHEFRVRWREIQPVDRVRDLAEECLDRFQIRSADAMQLAAALGWCKQMPRNRPIICYDSELGVAARQCGFDVLS
jgi:predicted nucleic acid-binding protein